MPPKTGTRATNQDANRTPHTNARTFEDRNTSQRQMNRAGNSRRSGFPNREGGVSRGTRGTGTSRGSEVASRGGGPAPRRSSGAGSTTGQSTGRKASE